MRRLIKLILLLIGIFLNLYLLIDLIYEEKWGLMSLIGLILLLSPGSIEWHEKTFFSKKGVETLQPEGKKNEQGY